MPGLRLCLSGCGEEELVPLRSDEIDLEIDFLLGRPLVAQLGESVIRPGHPVVPEAYRQRARRTRGVDIRSYRCRRSRAEKPSPIETAEIHVVCLPARTAGVPLVCDRGVRLAERGHRRCFPGKSHRYGGGRGIVG